MHEGHEACAVCGARASSSDARMSKVVIEGRALTLCRAHADSVLDEMPETFDELRAIFVGAGAELEALGGQPERRSPIDRRAPEDRRVFPPRPEGRRTSAGRRATDPRQ
jgi:hypothetical protein